jgi:hypothetical protein
LEGSLHRDPLATHNVVGPVEFLTESGVPGPGVLQELGWDFVEGASRRFDGPGFPLDLRRAELDRRPGSLDRTWVGSGRVGLQSVVPGAYGVFDQVAPLLGKSAPGLNHRHVAFAFHNGNAAEARVGGSDEGVPRHVELLPE